MTLTKTRTVLHRDDGDTPLFTPPATDGEDNRAHQLYLDPEVWVAMGRPDIITMSVEPGDLINGEPTT